MSKAWQRLAAGLTIAGCLGGPLAAEETLITTVKDIWEIYYQRLSSGANFCSAAAVYGRDGNTLFQFGIVWRPNEDNLTPIIVITNLNWELRPGGQVTVEARIERTYAGAYALDIISQNAVAFAMDEDMIRPFMVGTTLALHTPRAELSYDLTGSYAAAVAVFRECVQPIVRRTTVNPFQGPSQEPPPADPFGTRKQGPTAPDEPA